MHITNFGATGLIIEAIRLSVFVFVAIAEIEIAAQPAAKIIQIGFTGMRCGVPRTVAFYRFFEVNIGASCEPLLGQKS